ncbi:MAG: arsenate reductase ArsC [Candidatus Scalindua sp.]
MKKRVLFICTHNSARSQMAEGLMNALPGDQYEALSAGTEPSQVNLYAIKSMSEIDIDISPNRSKNILEFKGTEFDYVITVCDNAKERCPVFPGKGKHIHKGFTDPSRAKGSDDQKLMAFRMVRNEIRDWIQNYFESVK